MCMCMRSHRFHLSLFNNHCDYYPDSQTRRIIIISPLSVFIRQTLEQRPFSMAIDSASSASASLAPGFRFHPTDEELVRYYLRRKICGKAFRFDAISEIDIYKVEPWDLPDKSRLKSRDLEWYFFSFLDRKYGNGSKTNRATDRGYWKTTGKDRAVYHKSVVVGMKKTLVYHNGRAPRGERTNWVMHEYRLIDDNIQNSAVVKDAFVLCRIFRKSGAGPKNGEKYGAPFVEEEWDDDEELTLVPKEEVLAGGISCLDGNDLDQILSTDDPSEISPPPLKLLNGDDSTVISESSYEVKNPELGMGENNCDQHQIDDPKFFDLPVQQHDVPANSVKREYIGESSNNSDTADIDYYLDESFLDAKDNFSFLESKDLQNPVEADACGFDMLEEYLTYFDADGGDNSEYMNLYSSTTREGDEHLISDPTPFSNEYMEETLQEAKLLEGQDSDVASSSSEQDHSKFESDIQYPYMKRAGHILDSIPAPPAFASEFSTKEALLHLKSATSQTPSSVRVTAGMIQINNITWNVDWSLGKHGGISLILSFGPCTSDHDNDDDDNAQTRMDKVATSVDFLGLFCFMFIWVIILSMSYKIGKYICAN